MLKAIICPTKFISLYSSQGDFIMALANLIDREKINTYEQAIVKTGLPIYLDNGVFETGKPDSIDSLLEKASRTKAKIIFAPDALFDEESTRKSIEYFSWVKKQQKVNIKTAVVCQANTVESYLKFYKELEKNPEVDLIGLSYLAIAECFREKNKRLRAYEEYINPRKIISNRIKMLELINKLPGMRKSAHLLGCGDSYEDIIIAKEKYSWITSQDSSLAFQSGVFGRSLAEPFLKDLLGKPKDKVDFELKLLSLNQRILIQKNINKVLKI
jgi:hypothetical protein